MSQRVPDRLDPWRFADLEKEISGEMPLELMHRLSGCLLESAGVAHFHLRFQRDPQRRATLVGNIRADLVLECQRCLEAVSLPVNIEVSVAFVEGFDQAAQLPDAVDPCVVEDGQIHLRDLIEDELLLVLPQVAKHDLGGCPEKLIERADDKPVIQKKQDDVNPFAVLAELKRDDK